MEYIRWEYDNASDFCTGLVDLKLQALMGPNPRRNLVRNRSNMRNGKPLFCLPKAIQLEEEPSKKVHVVIRLAMFARHHMRQIWGTSRLEGRECHIICDWHTHAHLTMHWVLSGPANITYILLSMQRWFFAISNKTLVCQMIFWTTSRNTLK